MIFSEVSEGKRRLECPFFSFLKKVYSKGFIKFFLLLNLHIFPAGYRFSTFSFLTLGSFSFAIFISD